MKKILLGCVAFAAIVTAGSFMYYHDQNKDAAHGALTAKSATEFGQEVRMYSVQEEQILEALENYLSVKNLTKVLKADIQSDGDDFIITFNNPSNPKGAKQELKMIRIDDFYGKPQYKIETTSWTRWQEIIKQSFPGSIDTMQATYKEAVSWVPDLQLKTNSSINVNNLKMQGQNVSITAQAFAADYLATPENDKLNIASATNITDLTLKSPLGELNIPKFIQTTQISGADMVGNDLLQILSGTVHTNVQIPTFSVVSPLLQNDKISASMETTTDFNETLHFHSDISNVKVSEAFLGFIPSNIVADVSFDGIKKEDLESVILLQNEWINLTEDEAIHREELENKLVAKIENIAANAVLNINKIALYNDQAGMELNGKVTTQNDTASVKGNITVVNFDVISPDPMDNPVCQEALATDKELPAQCAMKPGILGFLRQFLPTAKHSTTSDGKSVDVFAVDLNEKAFLINGMSILEAEQQSENGTPNE